MLITVMFSVVAVNQGLFLVSHIQLLSRCVGSGREQSQTDSQVGQWKYSIPETSQSVYARGWLGGRRLSAFHFSMSFNPLLSMSSAFWGHLMKFAKIQGVRDLCSGTGCGSVIEW